MVIAAPWAIAAPRMSFLRGGLSDDQLLTSASVNNEVSLWYARVFIFGVTIHNGAAGTLWLIVVAMGRCSNLILGAKRFQSFECYDSMPSGWLIAPPFICHTFTANRASSSTTPSPTVLFRSSTIQPKQKTERHGSQGLVQTRQTRKQMGHRIQDVADIKKAIKAEMTPELDSYPTARLAIKATKKQMPVMQWN